MRTIDFIFNKETNDYLCVVFLIDPEGLLVFTEVSKEKIHYMFKKDYGGLDLKFIINRMRKCDELIYYKFEQHGYQKMPDIIPMVL